MSVQTYAPLSNLPAPVTTGTAIQSYTDVWGEIWVAKNGVNNGTWFKAREVLKAAWQRTAAFNTAGTPTLFAWDTMIYDTYGLYVTSPTWGYVVPVPGWYRIFAEYAFAGTATTQYGGIRIMQNATMITNENTICNAATGQVYTRSQSLPFAAAGDTFTVQYWSSTASMVGTAGAPTRFTIDFQGPG
jgi:hypothetical protein